MLVHQDIRLKDFQFWSGARHNAQKLNDMEFGIVENILSDIYPNGIDETTLNDLFWFDFEVICSWLGYEPNNLFED